MKEQLIGDTFPIYPRAHFISQEEPSVEGEGKEGPFSNNRFFKDILNAGFPQFPAEGFSGRWYLFWKLRNVLLILGHYHRLKKEQEKVNVNYLINFPKILPSKQFCNVSYLDF